MLPGLRGRPGLRQRARNTGAATKRARKMLDRDPLRGNGVASHSSLCEDEEEPARPVWAWMPRLRTKNIKCQHARGNRGIDARIMARRACVESEQSQTGTVSPSTSNSARRRSVRAARARSRSAPPASRGPPAGAADLQDGRPQPTPHAVVTGDRTGGGSAPGRGLHMGCGDGRIVIASPPGRLREVRGLERSRLRRQAAERGPSGLADRIRFVGGRPLRDADRGRHGGHPLPVAARNLHGAAPTLSSAPGTASLPRPYRAMDRSAGGRRTRGRDAVLYRWTIPRVTAGYPTMAAAGARDQYGCAADLARSGGARDPRAEQRGGPTALLNTLRAAAPPRGRMAVSAPYQLLAIWEVLGSPRWPLARRQPEQAETGSAPAAMMR